MKKRASVFLALFITAALLGGCSNKSGTSEEITVVSREDGSGTRGAFIELFGIEDKGDDGSKVDRTTKEAIIADKTDVMMTNISSDPYAIGYISLGSLNEKVKALAIDGVPASAETIDSGAYKIQRPFNIATKGEVSEVTKDFIDFILSADGQDVVEENKYMKVIRDAPPYEGSLPSGKITIVGSSSVTPVMEKLREAYLEINASAEIEIQMSDSSAGMTAAINGTCDIGMASRDLKDSEKAELSDMPIAIDGIVVVVNNESPVTGLSSEQVKGIFTGEITDWSEIA